ncbi:MAG: RnfABCDGE type electron transport complex subunit G [Prevotellaceae bacterium]|jgi:electron transport complex protein RnfG|nr:RnfABCDGE type electron transport complex subunit G [Prevotellaceae bacterium]
MARESSFKNMTLTLFVITFVSSAVLAGVYELTKDAIDAVRIRKINQGIAEVLPPFNNNPSDTDNVHKEFVDGDTVYVYKAITKERKDTVAAVQTFTNNGYGGKFVLLVGFLADGTINNIKVISHSETPGLGDKIDPAKHGFSLQFHGKNPETYKLAVSKEDGDVDAITASTISSKAFCDAVARAYAVYREKVMKKGKWDGNTGATSQQ